GDELAAVDAVAGGPHDLGHVGPHAVPAIAAEAAAVASALHRDQAIGGLVADRIHIAETEVGVAQGATGGVVLDAHEVGELGGAAQAADALLFTGREAADWPAENTVH